VVAEAQATLCAGEFCCNLGLKDIILEGDSSQVVNAVNANGPKWCRYGQLVVDIQMVLSTRRSWQIRHIRSGNFFGIWAS
jgi:ribonuclease HI